MPNLMDLAAELIMHVSSIQDDVRKYGGACTWKFTQCKDPVRTVIGKSKGSKDGICAILSAQWVCDEARGKSTKERLAGPGGEQESVDPAQIALLAQAHATCSEGNQDNAIDLWMKANGVTQRYERFDTTSGGMGAGAAKIDMEELFDDLLGKAKKPGVVFPLYSLISIGEKNRVFGEKAHAMAIKFEPINASSVRYFDPNYGEFVFPNTERFKTWFADYFKTSPYQKYVGTHYSLRFF